MPKLLTLLAGRPRLVAGGLLGVALGAALALSFSQTRLASSQNVILTANVTERAVPLDDPFAAIWDDVSAVDVPLSAQTVTIPTGGGSISTVAVRSLRDEENLYILLEWQDETQDLSASRTEDFRDAAAVEFPANPGGSLPAFCMGQSDARVNIWHWKADWQRDIDEGFVSVQDVYPNTAVDDYPFQGEDTFYSGFAAGNPLSVPERQSPVENLVSASFGTLTHSDIQDVAGRGVWRDSVWRVLYVRAMGAGSGEEIAPLEAASQTNVAFAVWDGSHGDRNGQKSVSQFVDFFIAGEAAGAPGPSAAEGFGAGDAGLIILVAAIFGVPAAALLLFAAIEGRRRTSRGA